MSETLPSAYNPSDPADVIHATESIRKLRAVVFELADTAPECYLSAALHQRAVDALAAYDRFGEDIFKQKQKQKQEPKPQLRPVLNPDFVALLRRLDYEPDIMTPFALLLAQEVFHATTRRWPRP